MMYISLFFLCYSDEIQKGKLLSYHLLSDDLYRLEKKKKQCHVSAFNKKSPQCRTFSDYTLFAIEMVREADIEFESCVVCPSCAIFLVI